MSQQFDEIAMKDVYVVTVCFDEKPKLDFSRDVEVLQEDAKKS
jgi:hypothetical protein